MIVSHLIITRHFGNRVFLAKVLFLKPKSWAGDVNVKSGKQILWTDERLSDSRVMTVMMTMTMTWMMMTMTTK